MISISYKTFVLNFVRKPTLEVAVGGLQLYFQIHIFL